MASVKLFPPTLRRSGPSIGGSSPSLWRALRQLSKRTPNGRHRRRARGTSCSGLPWCSALRSGVIRRIPRASRELSRVVSSLVPVQGSSAPPEVLAAHSKALQMARLRAPLEETIAAAVSADEQLLGHSISLIALEEKDGDPLRVSLAFERALALFPVTAELWVRYTRFLAQKVKVGSVVEAAFARALRNCPRSGRLWANAVRASELRGDAAGVEATFRKALAKGTPIRISIALLSSESPPKHPALISTCSHCWRCPPCRVPALSFQPPTSPPAPTSSRWPLLGWTSPGAPRTCPGCAPPRPPPPRRWRRPFRISATLQCRSRCGMSAMLLRYCRALLHGLGVHSMRRPSTREGPVHPS